MQEERWMAALREGDLGWFPELVEAYKQRIYALAWRKTGNAADAEDLAQEIFIQFYRKLPLFRGDSQLSTWLYRVALNRSISFHRQRMRGVIVQLRPDPPDHPDDFTTESAILLAERRHAVSNAMAQLRNHDREVLELFYFQQLSTAQIAEILGLAARSVETRLRRARTRMKNHLEKTGIFEEVTEDDEGKRRSGAVAAKC